MTREKKAKKAHIFFSSSNQLVFRHKTGQKIISIRGKLEAIAKDRAQFHFSEQLIEDSARKRERTITESFVREEDVIGRNDDKEEILKFLLNPHVEENVAVKCICGLGGLGKTTLAQSVYNDDRVKNHFKDLQKWVCVSNDFNVTSIAEAILGSESNGHEVKTKLKEQLKEKRYIIVLDDVWNDDRANWLDLKTLLDYGARGSKVIVTTREEKVAGVCGDTYCIQSLSPDQSWAMFCKFAFTGGKEPTEKNLIKTAKEIVKKCRGVPLAIRVLGSMLYGIRSEQWSTFLNSELSSIDQLRDSIMPILQVSYDNLPSHLKNCFAYCALFPQDYLYDMKKVVDFWVAQGFIPPSNSSRSLEDTGYIYCEELIERSFFQRFQSECPEFGGSEWFKMHDLIHDLASLVSGMMHHDEHHRNVRHYRGDTWHKSLESTKLRSIVYLKFSKGLYIDLRSVCEATSLRVLDLSDSWVLEVPNCIAKLKHLRYLNLSGTQIRKLPKSICRLQNLRTLILCNCFNLRVLPRGLTKLVNLEHFSLGCYFFYFTSGSGKVTCLQKLPKLFPSQKQGTFNLGELKELNKLRDLEISCAKLQSHLEAKDANLEGNENMRRLLLGYLTNDEILEAFRPHENLKELELIMFDGVNNIPNWLTTLTNLASIYLTHSDTCKYLPPLHQLPALKSLKLNNLPALKYIADDKELPSLSSSFFPSLEKLQLILLSMKAWWKTQAIEDGNGHKAASTSMPQYNNNEQQHLLYQFPHLSQLVIGDCPNLTSIPASQVQIRDLSLNFVNETLEHCLRNKQASNL